MRPFIYLLALLLFSNVAAAQIQRGNQLIILDRAGGLVPPYAAGLGGLSVTENPLADQTEVALNFGVTYGYAVLDRLILGANLGVGVAHLGELSGSYRLDPFARYYLVNQPKLGVFGQVGTSVYNQGGQFGGSAAFEQLDLKVGVQLPVGAGLLLTPAVDYTVIAGRNVLSVGAGLELLLQPRTDGEPFTGSFGKGTVTLGAQSASLAHRRNIFQSGLSVGGQYFLTDRLAAGAQIGLGYLRIDAGDFPGNVRDSYGYVSVDIGAGARYYLTPPKRLAWFADGGVGYIHTRSSSIRSLDITTTSTAYLSAGAGAQYFIRNNVALEVAPQLRYNLSDYDLNSCTQLGVNFGFRVML